MNVGIDYWQVISHYPDYFTELIMLHANNGNEVHVISAIGKNRIGTIMDEVKKAVGLAAFYDITGVHEVVFDTPAQSPELKLAKCQELGITAFYDDRDDVCRLLNKNGILAMRVTRKDNSTYDLGAERA